MMRIVHLSTADIAGGAFVAAQRLVAAQCAAGLKATLVVGEQALKADYLTTVGQAGLGPLLPLARKAGEALSLIGELAHWKRDRFLFAATRFGVNPTSGRLGKLIAAADVIHMHWTHHGFLSLRGLEQIAKANKPVVWTLHDFWPLSGGCLYARDCTRYLDHCGHCPMLAQPSDSDLSAQRWQQKAELYTRLRPHFVAVSAWLASEAQRAPLTRPYPVSHIPNPLDTEIFAPRDAAQARAALGLEAHRPIVLFVARSIEDPRKGLRDLCEALQDLPEVQLVTVGAGSLPEAYRGRLRYRSFAAVADANAMAKFYDAADVFCIPSHEEALGYTALEAQACGRPVVGYRTGGIPEVVTDGETGILVPTGAVGELRAALSTLIANPARREQMGRAGRQHAVARYSAAAVAEQYRARYAELLSASR